MGFVVVFVFEFFEAGGGDIVLGLFEFGDVVGDGAFDFAEEGGGEADICFGGGGFDYLVDGFLVGW